jgi:glutamate synthase domain-containing protein 2
MTKPPSIAEIAPAAPNKPAATTEIPQVAKNCHRNTARKGLATTALKLRGSAANLSIVLRFVASRQTVLRRNMRALIG